MCLFLFFRNAKKSKFPQAKGGQCKITDWQTQERAVGAEVYERQNNSTTELTVEVKMQSQLRLRLRTQRNNGPLKHNETGKREEKKQPLKRSQHLSWLLQWSCDCSPAIVDLASYGPSKAYTFIGVRRTRTNSEKGPFEIPSPHKLATKPYLKRTGMARRARYILHNNKLATR